MPEIMRTLLVCGAAIVVGVLLGNSAVYVFNHLPGEWLCDYGQQPDEELLHPTRQRLRSTPWKYVFSGLFIVCAIWIGIRAPLYGVAALAALWLLLLMSVADVQYRIVPDQLVLFLVVTGIGFIPFHQNGPLDCLWGGLTGFLGMLAIAMIGRLVSRKDALGGGDIKLFGALGLCAGAGGILAIFILTTLLSAAHMTWLLLRKRIKRTDSRPMAPYIAVSAGIYLLILHEMYYTITI